MSILTGGEAKKIFDEAQSMLKEIISDGSLEARGIIGFYPAHSVGDDIELDDPVSTNCNLSRAETFVIFHLPCFLRRKSWTLA